MHADNLGSFANDQSTIVYDLNHAKLASWVSWVGSTCKSDCDRSDIAGFRRPSRAGLHARGARGAH